MARGDAHALTTVYDRHGRLAYRIALQITGNATSAEDAVQEAFVQLWLHASTIDPERTSLVAWIVLLARRRAIDLVRRETRATRARSLRPEQTEAPAADEVALVEHERLRARAALSRLEPGHRDVIELAYYRGLSQSEIARALAIPLGTVKSRTRSALACLRHALSEIGEPGLRVQPATSVVAG